MVFKVSVLSLQLILFMNMKKTILKTSLELFVKHGFKTVTMDEIANELGISKKTIYLHFRSKDELITKTVDYIIDSAMDKKERNCCELRNSYS